jgi:hypothetical protein
MNARHWLSAPRAILTALAVLASAAAQAQFIEAPQATAVTAGSYTVTYLADCGPVSPNFYCVFASLEEKTEPSGGWISVSTGTGSRSFTNKPSGSYSYRLHAAGYDMYAGYVEGVSPSITVVVGSAAARDNIVAQLAYRYVVRQGDINADGRVDFFVARLTSGTASGGTIEKLILQQASGGRFVAVVPTAAQAAVAAAWPVSAVVPRLADIDVDGYADVMLAGVSSVVSNARDQIVYAPGSTGLNQPKGIRPFDDAMIRFAADTMDYFADQNFFIDNATPEYYTVWYWYSYCDSAYSGYSLYDGSYWDPITGCYYDIAYSSGMYQDYSDFSPQALTFWINDYEAREGDISEAKALANVKTAVEELIGTAIGGWPMEEILGPVGPHTEPNARRGIEIGQSVLGQARAGHDRVNPRLIPPQAPRLPDQIYITGHPLAFARSRGHLALEYTDSQRSGAPYVGETFSGEPENNNVFNFGKLLAKNNRPTDHPLLNFYIGDVNPLRTSNALYWQNYLRPRHQHYIALPYSAKVNYAIVPSAATGTSNSNGYVAGLTTDGPGNVSIEVPPNIAFRYPGWSVPVPEVKFR